MNPEDLLGPPPSDPHQDLLGPPPEAKAPSNGPSGYAADSGASPSNGQAVAQAVETPLRGFRGLGVGAELLGNKALGQDSSNTFGAPDPLSLSQIADRAAAATKPGYRARYGERAGAAVGEAVAALPVMEAAGGGGLMAQAFKGALSTGALNALSQASDRGEIEPVGLAVSSAFGGAIPLIAPTVGLVARAIRGSTTAMATGGTTLDREAVQALDKNPKLLDEFKGTAAAIGEKVKKIQQALIEQHAEAGKLLEAAREKIGFRETFSQASKRLQSEGFKPPDEKELIRDFNILSHDEIPVEVVNEAKRVRLAPKPLGPEAPPPAGATEEMVAAKKKMGDALNAQQSGLSDFLKRNAGKESAGVARELAQRTQGIAKARAAYDAAAAEVRAATSRATGAAAEDVPEYMEHFATLPETRVSTKVALEPKARIRDLLRLREKIDGLIHYPVARADVPKIAQADESFLKAMRGKINEVIDKIPEGKEIRETDDTYSQSRELYDDFQKAMGTQGKAEEIIRRLAKGGEVDDLIGKPGEYARLLREVEEKKGEALLDPALSEMHARAFRHMHGKGYGGVLSDALGPEATLAALRGAQKFSRGLEKVSAPFLGAPGVHARAAVQALGEESLKYNLSPEAQAVIGGTR